VAVPSPQTGTQYPEENGAAACINRTEGYSMSETDAAETGKSPELPEMCLFLGIMGSGVSTQMLGLRYQIGPVAI